MADNGNVYAHHSTLHNAGNAHHFPLIKENAKISEEGFAARVTEFEKQHGILWKPAPLLLKLAAEGRTFAEYDKTQGE